MGGGWEPSGAWGAECFPSTLLRPGWVRAAETGDYAWVSLQEAEQELLAQVQSTLGSVGQGYSVALLLRGRETEEPRLVPQVSPRGAPGCECHEAQVLPPLGDF